MTESRKRLLLVASSLSVLLCVGGATFALQSTSSQPSVFVDGPLYTDEPDLIGLERGVGAKFSYGITVLHNAGDEALALESASFADPTPGLQLLGAFVLGPRRVLWAFSSDSGALLKQRHIRASRDSLRPLRGDLLQPDSVGKPGVGAELVLYARTTRRGRFETHGIVVGYRYHGKRHLELLPRALVVCAPSRTIARNCSHAPAPIPARGSVSHD